MLFHTLLKIFSIFPNEKIFSYALIPSLVISTVSLVSKKQFCMCCVFQHIRFLLVPQLTAYKYSSIQGCISSFVICSLSLRLELCAMRTLSINSYNILNELNKNRQQTIYCSRAMEEYNFKICILLRREPLPGTASSIFCKLQF